MRLKLMATGVSTAVAVAVVAVAGSGNGHPAQDVRLLSGAAWFASAKVGQVTLLDGATAEVSAQVQVAPAGNQLDVVQQGSTAYAVDRSAGTIRRVDGATFDLTQPETPIPDVSRGLAAIAGRTALYTLDTERGILASTDPRTLSRRGDMISVASKLAAGTATVDDHGTLWTIDTTTGFLNRVNGERRSIHREVAQPGASVITIVNGHPVVVDRAAHKAVSVHPETGSARGGIDLDLRPDDTLQVSGSPHNERLYTVLGRGVLNICDLDAGHCDNAIPLSAGNEFGAAVESANRLFVPNYSTGEVWIVDLAQNRVVAKPDVLRANGKFQLLTRDGVVFYNDTASEKAGVIHLDGTFTPTAKYDPADPDKGVVTAPNRENPVAPQQQRQTSPAPTPPDVSQPPADPRNPETPQNPPSPQDPQNPPDSPDLPDPRNPREPPVLHVTMSDTSPQADQPIELTVANTRGSPVRAAEWDFGDGNHGEGAATSHKWAAARSTPYQVVVTATVEDGQTGMLAVPITVSDRPAVRLTVQVPGVGGTVTGEGIACPSDCEGDYPQDTAVTLTAQPDARHVTGTWAGCGTANGNTCSVTMNAARNVSHTFRDAPPDQVRLTVRTPANGKVAGGALSCPATCSVMVEKGRPVNLKATPNQETFEFVAWGDACAGRAGDSCQVLPQNPETVVSATFRQRAPIVIRVRSERADIGAPGQGRITGPNGFACTVPCDQTLQAVPGATITLTAEPAGRKPPLFHRFQKWEGVCNSSDEVCTFKVTGPGTVTGFFYAVAA
ncbi:MAG: PKD domain-containing protein [Kibdelosporangium sp.]